MNNKPFPSVENEAFEYARKYIEIYIDGDDYVQFDHRLNKEVMRRPATEEEKTSLSDDDELPGMS